MSLTAVEIEFLRLLALNAPLTRPAGKAARLFSEQHGIGTVLGRTVHYSTRDLASAAGLLANLGLSTARLPAGALRSEAADRAGLSEKSGTSSPHSNCLMLKTANGFCFRGPRSLESDRGGYQVLTRESAGQVQCDVVMFVENLETFRYIEDYGWIDYQGMNVVAAYRGDNTFRADDALSMIDGRRRIWHFGDFDPAGLGIAISLASHCVLERVIHPNITWLEERAAEAGLVRLYGDQFQQYSALLDGSVREDIALLWAAMRKSQAGLPQEWMVSAPA